MNSEESDSPPVVDIPLITTQGIKSEETSMYSLSDVEEDQVSISKSSLSEHIDQLVEDFNEFDISPVRSSKAYQSDWPWLDREFFRKASRSRTRAHRASSPKVKLTKVQSSPSYYKPASSLSSQKRVHRPSMSVPQRPRRKFRTPKLSRARDQAVYLADEGQLPPENEANVTTFKEIMESIQKCIQSIERKPVQVNLDELLGKTIHVVFMKERYKENKRWLVFEEDTRYENIYGPPAKYTHTCQYDQETSVSLQISKGHKIGIGAGFGGNIFGGNVGFNTGYEYSKRKSEHNSHGRGKSKISSVEIIVPEKKAIIVKELIYKVEKRAMCEVELILNKKDEILYTISESTEQKIPPSKIEIKKLWNLSSLKECNWIKEESNGDNKSIVCSFTATCCCITTMHCMETIEQISDLNRSQTILKKYQSSDEETTQSDDH